MKVYVFGNEDVPFDNKPFKIIEKLKADPNINSEIEFVMVELNKDLVLDNKESNKRKVIILDTIEGIKQVTQLNETDLDNLVTSNSSTVHDFDLGFQLKYLKKLGKLDKVIIIGVPMSNELNKLDYFRVQRILRKLVAQDMQGS